MARIQDGVVLEVSYQVGESLGREYGFSWPVGSTDDLSVEHNGVRLPESAYRVQLAVGGGGGTITLLDSTETQTFALLASGDIIRILRDTLTVERVAFNTSGPAGGNAVRVMSSHVHRILQELAARLEVHADIHLSEEQVQGLVNMALSGAVKDYAETGGRLIALGDTDFPDSVEGAFVLDASTWDAGTRTLTLTTNDGRELSVTIPEGGGMGGGGGLTQAQVDARVRAGVEDPAETGNTDRWPVAKLGSGTADANAILFGDGAWKSGNAFFTALLDAAIPSAQRIPAAAQGDAGEPLVGVAGGAPRYAPLAASQVAVTASGFDGMLSTTDDTAQKVAQKVDDLAPSYGITDERTAVFDAFDGDAWQNDGDIIRVATVLSSVPNPTNPENFTYLAVAPPVGPRYQNDYMLIRVAAGLREQAAEQGRYTIGAMPPVSLADATFLETSGGFSYFIHQVPDKPAGSGWQAEWFHPLELDPRFLPNLPADRLPNIPVTRLPHIPPDLLPHSNLVDLMDTTGIGVTVTNAGLVVQAVARDFTQHQFSLDTNVTDEIHFTLDWSFGTRSDNGLAFASVSGDVAEDSLNLRARDKFVLNAADILAADDFVMGGVVEGVRGDVRPVYRRGVLQGNLEFWAIHQADDNLRYGIQWQPDAGAGTYNFAIGIYIRAFASPRAGTSGLDQTAVDARVRALVADEAETGNTGIWPVGKLGGGVPDSTKVLYGDGTWKDAPTGGGGGGGTAAAARQALFDPSSTAQDWGGYSAVGSTTIAASVPRTISLAADGTLPSGVTLASNAITIAAAGEVDISVSLEVEARTSTSNNNTRNDVECWLEVAASGSSTWNEVEGSRGTTFYNRIAKPYDNHGPGEGQLHTSVAFLAAAGDRIRVRAECIYAQASGMTHRVTDGKVRLVLPAVGGGGSGDGASTFLGLTDTPGAYGSAGQLVAVNGTRTALSFVDAPSGGGLNNAQVGALVRTIVADPAEVGNTSRWATSKLGSGTADATRVLYGDGAWRVPPAVGLNQSQVDARVQAGVIDAAETGNTDRWPQAKLGSGAANNGTILYGDGTWKAASGAGQTQAQIDARVRAGVADPAEQGNTDRWPVAKLGSGTPSGTRVLYGDGVWKDLPAAGLSQTAVDGRVRALVADFAEQGNTSLLPISKIQTASTARRGVIQLANNSQADAGVAGDRAMTPGGTSRLIRRLVANPAEEGNTDRWPVAKLGSGSPSASNFLSGDGTFKVPPFSPTIYTALSQLPTTGLTVGDIAYVRDGTSAVMQFMAVSTTQWLCVGGTSGDFAGSNRNVTFSSQTNWTRVHTTLFWDFRFPYFELSFGATRSSQDVDQTFFKIASAPIAALRAGSDGAPSQASERVYMAITRPRTEEPAGYYFGRTSSNQVLIHPHSSTSTVTGFFPLRIRGTA